MTILNDFTNPGGAGIGGTPVDPLSPEGSLIDLASEVAGILGEGGVDSAIARDSEVASSISTHAGVATAHHTNANDPNATQKNAFAGTSGTPDTGNEYVTDADPRNSDARTPTAHATTHLGDGGDETGYAVVGEPTGFPNLTDTTISWVDGTKIFTIAPTGATFDVWVLGKKFTKTGAQTKNISGVIAEGCWYFYYDSAGVLQASQTPFDFMQHATVAVVHWDATNTVAITFAEERHLFFMPRQTMEFIHLAYGLVYVSGLGLTPKTLPIPGDGTADADAEIELADGVLLDEDLTINPRDSGSGHFVQDLQPIAQLPVFHRETATGVWRKKTANNFPLREGPGAGNDRLQWNDPDAGGAGVWGLSEVGDGEFVAVFICAAPEVDEPVFCILGQETYATQQAAQEANVYADLALGTMAFREQRILYRIIFQTFDSYSNTPKARVVETIDLRAAQLGSPAGTIVPSVHNALSGRGDSDVHPAASIAPDTSNFDRILSAADDTVQKALDTLESARLFAYLTSTHGGTVPYVQNNTTSYAAVVQIKFPGTDNLSVDPVNAEVIGSAASNGSTSDYRIQDITNALTIAEVTGAGTNVAPAVIDLGTVSNLPTGPAIFELQHAKNTGGAARVAAVCLNN